MKLTAQEYIERSVDARRGRRFAMILSCVFYLAALSVIPLVKNVVASWGSYFVLMVAANTCLMRGGMYYRPKVVQYR